MRRSRVSLYLFVAVQVIGVACSWLWQFVPSAIGVPLWGTALVVLVPGNFLGEWVVERLLWRSGVSLVGMSVISTVLAVAINAVVWYAVVKAICSVAGRLRKSTSGLP